MSNTEFNCPHCNQSITLSINKPPNPDQLSVNIRHIGFWITDSGSHVAVDDIARAKNSVILDPESMLYVYKLALRHLLLSQRIIDPQDIDSQNLVPHFAIGKNKNESLNQYSLIQGKQFILGSNDIVVKNDFILLEFDRTNNLHTTLIYKRGIKQKIDLMQCFKIIVCLLNLYPHLVYEYSNLDYFGKSNAQYWYDTPGILLIYQYI